MTLSNFQNSWPENLSVLRIKSIEKLSIFELMWYWYLLLPKRRMFTKSLSVALMISLSIDLILFMRVCLCNEKWWQCRKKWTLFSTLKLHEQSGLIQSLKLWLNLWSLRWLKPNRRRINNFNPVGLWIPYVSLHLGLTKLTFFSWTLSTIQMTLWYCLNCSTHSQYMEKNEFLKSSVLTLKFGRDEKRLV